MAPEGTSCPRSPLAEALRSSGHEPTLLTEGRAVEGALLDRCKSDEGRIPTNSLQVGRSGIGLPVRLAQATLQARRFLAEHEVDVLVGAGGRTTVPATLAARSLGLPVFLLEQNVVTGRSNRMLSPLARRIYYGLPPRRTARHGVLTGTPLRAQVGSIAREAARKSLGLSLDLPVVMVTGVARVARFLNEVVPRALAATGREMQVLHLSGAGAEQEVTARYHDQEQLRAMVRPVVMDMASMYSAADLILCRGGGGTVAELMKVGRGAIILPYPHHRDRQQWHNGQVLASIRAAILREEAELDEAELTRLIDGLLGDPDELAAMGQRAAALSTKNACEEILADMRSLGALD